MFICYRVKTNVGLLHAECFFQLGNGYFYFVVIVHQRHVHRMFGTVVMRFAQLELFPDKGVHLLGGLVEQQGPHGLAHLEMSVQHLGRAFQIYGLSLPVDIVHVVEEARCPPATTDDDVFKLGHLVEHVSLHLSEACLAPLVEYLLHRFVHAALDIPVEVVEGHVQVGRQRFSHGGLSRPHISYEDDSRPLPLRRGAGGGGVCVAHVLFHNILSES